MQDNKSVVREFLSALGAGDAERLKSVITEDIAAICTGTSVLSGTRHHAEILATTAGLKQVTQNGIDFKILNLTAEDDRVACEAEGRSILVTGTPYNNQYHFLFTLRDGKVCGLKEYIDTKLADAVLGPLMTAA